MTDGQIKKDVKKYIKDVRSYLLCDYKTQSKFINRLKNDIFSYIEDNSVNDINKVYEQFGKPEDIAKNFFKNSDMRRIKRKMNIGRMIIFGAAAALIIWAVGVSISFVDGKITDRQSIPEYYVSEEQAEIYD